MRLSRRLTTLAGGVLLAFALTGPSSAGALAGAVRLGSAPSIPPGARTTGAVAADTPMHVTIVLAPRDAAALEAFANAVSAPGSPQFRDYITPAQFAQRFGATPNQIQAVESSLRAHGLQPGPPAANDLSIPVTATAGTLMRAFDISLAHVALASGASAIVNQQAPALDAAIAPAVQAVLGLDTVSRAKPLLVRPHFAAPTASLRPHVVTGGPQPCPAASSAGASFHGYTADQIASAYGLSGIYTSAGASGGSDQGAGQTIAVLELEPYDPSDIAAYEQCYGVSAPLANVIVDSGAGSGSGSGEAALDIENVIGLAPQASVIVYEGPNSGAGPYDTFSAMITQHAAQVITASWGQCEPLNGFSQATAENTLFQEAAAQGQTIMSASGDDGAQDCFPASPAPQVDDPASQPFVTGVGGTSLTSLGPPPSESAWNDGPPPVGTGAGGGGVSSFWTMPSYQLEQPAALHVINSGSSGSPCAASPGYCREVPDVSADADPATGYVIYWNGNGAAGPGNPQGWQVVGGTSGAAPAWAALIALANASASCGAIPVGFANPALYHAAAVAYASDFYDIGAGNNDMTRTNGGQYATGSAYDMASGLGTPNGSGLVATLCADSIGVTNPGAQRSVVRSPVSLQIQALDTRGATMTYSAAGLPAGLSINPSSGKITGHPRHIGSSTVTVTASNRAGTTGQTAFMWAIQGNPTLSHVSLSGGGHPRLKFMVAAGRDAPLLSTIAVALPRGLRFTRSRATVNIRGRGRRRVRFTMSLRHGRLVLKLRRASDQLHVTISYPRLQSTGRRRSGRVTLTVRATDAAALQTKLTARMRT